MENINLFDTPSGGAGIRQSAFKLDYQSGLGGNSMRVVTPQEFTAAVFDDQSRHLLQDGLASIPINFRVSKPVLNIAFITTIRQMEGPSTGRKNKTKVAERTLEFFVEGRNYLHLHPVGDSGTANPTGGIIDETFVGSSWIDTSHTVSGAIHGSKPNLLSFDKLFGLSMLSGCDYRMLALKGVMLLNQLISAYTLGLDRGAGAAIMIEAEQLTAEEVLERMTTRRIVIDVMGLCEDQVALLAVLCSRWPCQTFTHVHDGRIVRDMYSHCCIPPDDLLMFSSGDAVVQNCIRGYARTPDDCFHTLVNLFTNLDALDQLIEVMRDSRGLVPCLMQCTDFEEDSQQITLKYGRSRGTNVFLLTQHVDRSAKISGVSQLCSSSLMLLLDCLLGALAKMHLHGVNEMLGTINVAIYPSLGDGEGGHHKLRSMLRDHGYTTEGTNNPLAHTVMPWCSCVLSTAGGIERQLISTATDIRAQRSAGEMPGSNYCSMLGYHSITPPPLSTCELLTTSCSITPETVGGWRNTADNLAKTCSTVNWALGAGLGGDCISCHGLSNIYGSAYPFPSGPGIDWASLEGVYRIIRVAAELRNFAARRGTTGWCFSNFFRPVTNVSAEEGMVSAPVTDDPGARKISSIALRDRKSSVGQRRKEVIPDSDLTGGHDGRPVQDGVIVSGGEGPISEELLQHITNDFVVGEDVLGDGDCGLHALVASMGANGYQTNVNVMRQTLQIPDGTIYHQSDQDLAALANVCGFNLVVHTDKEVYYYINDPVWDDVGVYHTGHDHWRILKKGKNSNPVKKSVYVDRNKRDLEVTIAHIQEEIKTSRGGNPVSQRSHSAQKREVSVATNLMPQFRNLGDAVKGQKDGDPRDKDKTKEKQDDNISID